MTKRLTRSEVLEHNSNKSCWIIIGNKVYDVTKFLDEHPGGCEVLLEKAGDDRTEAFEDVGHSTDAREMREQYLVGEIVDDEKWQYSYDKKSSPKTTDVQSTRAEDRRLQPPLLHNGQSPERDLVIFRDLPLLTSDGEIGFYCFPRELTYIDIQPNPAHILWAEPYLEEDDVFETDYLCSPRRFAANPNGPFFADNLEDSHLIRMLVKRPFERRDGSLVLGRVPKFVKDNVSIGNVGLGRDMIASTNDETIRATSRFARKNCFFSPVQCSIYYKRSDPNMPHI